MQGRARYPTRSNNQLGSVLRAFSAGIRVHIALMGVVIGSGVVRVRGMTGHHVGAAFCGVAAHGMAAGIDVAPAACVASAFGKCAYGQGASRYQKNNRLHYFYLSLLFPRAAWVQLFVFLSAGFGSGLGIGFATLNK